MAIQFQYNKTSLNDLGKQLKVREGALPILKNKESALRAEVIKHKSLLKGAERSHAQVREEGEHLQPLIGRFPIECISIDQVAIENRKIAGVSIPVFQAVALKFSEILWHEAPHWYPDVFAHLEREAEEAVKLELARRQLKILERERKRTTQKVNLYEKVQIPDLREAVKKIKRFLEDKENLSKAAQKIVKARKMDS
ncbi:V-type ATP synthase subunit D [Cryomorphaceae bacterium]|nr:V-type ATP synthase subunit D [Cryomorphaceae bacterium]